MNSKLAPYFFFSRHIVADSYNFRNPVSPTISMQPSSCIIPTPTVTTAIDPKVLPKLKAGITSDNMFGGKGDTDQSEHSHQYPGRTKAGLASPV